MPLDYKQPKRIALKGMKKVHGLSTGNKSQITIVGCGNAAGQTLPPMVIFKGERFNHEWSVGEVPDTLYGMSENGWIDQELFFYWFGNIFLKRIPSQRPVILLCDGHSSHYSPEVITRAATHGVVLFCIPPNTTHVAQPLDVSFFGPLKHHWNFVCHQFLSENPGASITKLAFFHGHGTRQLSQRTLLMVFVRRGCVLLMRRLLRLMSSLHLMLIQCLVILLSTRRVKQSLRTSRLNCMNKDMKMVIWSYVLIVIMFLG